MTSRKEAGDQKQIVRERILSGRATLAVDTNIVHGGLGHLFGVANLVKHFNEKKPANQINLVVSAVVYMEVVNHTWHAKLKDFEYDRRSVEQRIKLQIEELSEKGISIVSFDQKQAENTAQVLSGWYKTDAEWQRAKQIVFQETLCLNDKFFSSKNKQALNCNATIDWVIAAQADAQNWILVTNDLGPEFSNVRLKINWDELKTMMKELLGGNL